MEDCSRYPTEYYLRVRAMTADGLFSSYDDGVMRQQREAAYRAVKEGLPGAEAFKRRLLDTQEKRLDARIRAAKQEIADFEFEEKYGMTREEYAQRSGRRQRIAADNAQAEAKALQDAWKELELDAAERYCDARSGGDGLTVEEKFRRGEIDRADYYRHKAARDKL